LISHGPAEEEAANALEYFERTLGPLTLGRALAAIRETEGYTLASFAKKLGVSRAHLCDIERARRGVSAERAARWAKALGHPARVFVTLALQDEVTAAGLKLKVNVADESPRWRGKQKPDAA
jgi:antitoxin HigA-1